MEEVSKFAMFIQGVGQYEDVWFRVEVENTLMPKNKRKMVRKMISPVAVLDCRSYGYRGSWEVIGDDIYWVGGCIWKGRFEVSKMLLKHNINNSSDIRFWETVSTSMKLPRGEPLITAVGEKKLYVLLGHEYTIDDDQDTQLLGDVDWNRCGEVYDIENGTWEYLAPYVEDLREYVTFHTALRTALVKEEGKEQLTGIAFFDLNHPLPLVYFNFHQQTLDSPDQSCLSGLSRIPVGPQGYDHTDPLFDAIDHFNMVFDDNTFYWFACNLRLYGYGIDRHVWLVSPSLEHEFHNLRCPPRFTMLATLGNGNLLVIVDEPDQPGCFTMATLTVRRDKDENGYLFLSVSVNSHQAFSLDHNHSFQPFGAKAVKLKNTAMHGQQQVMDDVYPIRKVEKIDSRIKAFISTCVVGGLGILLLKRRN